MRTTDHGEGTLAALINVLAVPLYVRDLVFLGHIDPGSDLGGAANGGLFVMIEFVVVLVVGIAVLLHRYRWVER